MGKFYMARRCLINECLRCSAVINCLYRDESQRLNVNGDSCKLEGDKYGRVTPRKLIVTIIFGAHFAICGLKKNSLDSLV